MYYPVFTPYYSVYYVPPPVYLHRPVFPVVYFF